MQNSVIIKDAIEKIEDCEDLIKEKQSILIENGRNISKGTKAAFDKLEKFEEATEELAARARAYAGVITGIVAVPLATSQILSYGLKLNNNAMIELAIKTAFLMLTYRISYLTNQHINKRIKAKEMYGSYDNYVEEKRKDELHGYEAIEIMDDLDYIGREKEKLQKYKQSFTDYLNNQRYINQTELTNQLMKANHKVNKLTRKLSTIQPNNNEFIDFN